MNAQHEQMIRHLKFAASYVIVFVIDVKLDKFNMLNKNIIIYPNIFFI
jgi:hypothetical protein